MIVERVDFVSVPTRDVERAIAFYRDVLGLKQNRRVPHELEAGNVTIQVWDPSESGIEYVASDPSEIALRVADVAETRTELQGKGVEFEGETVDTGVCHMAFFRDPDGNRLILHRRYAPYE